MWNNRWTNIPKIAKGYRFLGIFIALLGTLVMSGLGTTSVLASPLDSTNAHASRVVKGHVVLIRKGPSHIRQNSPKSSPNARPADKCLQEGASIVSPSSDTADALGETTNLCLATVAGSQYMSITNSCPDVGGGGYFTDRFSIAVGTTFDQTYDVGAGCVVCENGVAVGHPDFTLALNVTADGSFSYRGNRLNATSDIATSSTKVNNTGRYAPPCP